MRVVVGRREIEDGAELRLGLLPAAEAGSRRSRAPRGSTPSPARCASPSRAERSPGRSCRPEAAGGPPGRSRRRRSSNRAAARPRRGSPPRSRASAPSRRAARRRGRRARPRSRSRRTRCRCARDVVEDDEIGVLLVELPPLPLETRVAEIGAEGDEQLTRGLALAEQAGDVGRRLELERPGLGVLGALVASAATGPVVGDRRGEQRDVHVLEGEGGVEHRLGGRRRDRLDAGRARARRGSPRAGRRRRRGAAPPRRGRHPSVPTSGCRRTGPASTGSRVPPAVTRTRLPARLPGASSCSIRAAISSGSAMRPTPHSPSAVSPSSGPTSSTPRPVSVSTFARVAGCDHIRGFIAGATRTGPRCASAASVSTLSASPCASLASVFAVHGATTSRSARVRCS